MLSIFWDATVRQFVSVWFVSQTLTVSVMVLKTVRPCKIGHHALSVHTPTAYPAAVSRFLSLALWFRTKDVRARPAHELGNRLERSDRV